MTGLARNSYFGHLHKAFQRAQYSYTGDMRCAPHIHIIMVYACIAATVASGCTGDLDSVSGTTSALGDDSGDQILGDDFVEPSNETTTPEPGPTPALCIGPETIATSDAPYLSRGRYCIPTGPYPTSIQSCGFESVYGIDSFSDRVTLAVLLASW